MFELSPRVCLGPALPLEDCNTVIRVIGWLGGVSGSLTTLLFLFRANSVYHDSVPARAYFSCMWAIATVGHLVFPLSLSSQPVQPNALCVIESIKRFALVSPFVVGAFDWAAFLWISFKVIQAYAPNTDWRDKCRIFVTGAGINAVPRTLLRTGQFYIL